MRTYGRVTTGIRPDETKIRRWIEVSTTPDGSNDAVYLTTLIQVLLLNTNESPFYANWGIPARQAVMQQIPPDFWVALVQQNFAPFFTSIIITKESLPTPTYDVNVITKTGKISNFKIPVPM